jgi:acyl-CoA dehydrogenase
MLIDMRSSGVSLQPIRLMAGDHELNQVFFDDVEVLPEQLLGAEGGGWQVAKYLLEIERGSFVFGGRLRRRLRHVAALAESRKVPSCLADELAAIEVALLAYEASELRLGHLETGTRGVGAAAANLIKIEWTELIQRIDALAVGLTGRAALYSQAPGSESVYAENGEIPLRSELACYLNNRATTIYGGSNEIQRNLIYRALARQWV